MSKPTGILRPLGLAAVLAIGFGAVFALAAGWGLSIWDSLRHGERVGESVMVRQDGTPLIQCNRYDGYQSHATYHTLDGSEVPEPVEHVTNLWLEGASLRMPGRGWPLFPLDGEDRVWRFHDGLENWENSWYFVDDGARDGRGYFVGYDGQSKLRAGFIGRDGFRPDQPPVEQWFPMDGVKLAQDRAFPRAENHSAYGFHEPWMFPEGKVVMISGARLLEVDLRKRSVRTLMEAADLIAVGMFEPALKSEAAAEATRTHRQQHLAVRTTDRVVVFDATGKKHAAYPLPEELRDRSIAFYELGEWTALVTASRPLRDRSSHGELFWIDGSGKVLRRAEVSLAGAYGRHDEIGGSWKAALIVPSPLVLLFASTVGVPLGGLGDGQAPDYATALAWCLAAWWPALLVVTLLSAALAWYCCRRHRRYCQPASVVWFVFVLLTGLPGLVAYFFHRRWPVLEKCPACGQVVPRDRGTCAKCGVAFPPPAPKGCEVFA